MNEIITRLKEEQQELEDRMNKLNSFLYSPEFYKISNTQHSLLEVQAYAMATYLKCLNLRIEDLQ